MTSSEYKKICARPNVFRRSLLDLTEEFLKRKSLIKETQKIRSSQKPIEKPPLSKVDPKDDHFEVSLPTSIVKEIIAELGEVEAAVVVAKKSAADITEIASLVDKWNGILVMK